MNSEKWSMQYKSRMWTPSSFIWARSPHDLLQDIRHYDDNNLPPYTQWCLVQPLCPPMFWWSVCPHLHTSGSSKQRMANLIWVWGMLDLSLSSSKVLFQIPKWQISESVEMVTQRENGGRHVKTVLSQTLSQREQAAKPTEFVFLINVSVL